MVDYGWICRHDTRGDVSAAEGAGNPDPPPAVTPVFGFNQVKPVLQLPTYREVNLHPVGREHRGAPRLEAVIARGLLPAAMELHKLPYPGPNRKGEQRLFER